MMRILVISNLYPPVVLGGYEILCAQVVESLRRRGHEISVLTSDHDAGVSDASEGVLRALNLFQPFGQPAKMDRRRRRETGRSNERVTRKVLSDAEFDAVFIWSQLRLTVGPARAAERSGTPTFYTFNDTHPLGYVPACWRISPRSLARATIDRLIYPDVSVKGLGFENVTCISQCLKDELLAGGLPITSARVIHQGIPLDLFPCKSRPGLVRSPARLLYVGQLHAYKGVHTLLEAVVGLGDGRSGHDLTLTVVGAGDAEYERRLRAQADESAGRVRFIGKVAHSDLPEIYRDHDVFVFPSEWPEPFGLTHLEAMASGLAVISTAEGGHGEFLEDRVNSLTYPKGDVAALRERIERLLRDPDLAARVALGGRRVVEDRLSLTRYVDRLEHWIDSAMTQRREEV